MFAASLFKVKIVQYVDMDDMRAPKCGDKGS